MTHGGLSIRRYFASATFVSFALALWLASHAEAIGNLALTFIILIYLLARVGRSRSGSDAMITGISVLGWSLSAWSLAAVFLNKDVVYLADGLAYIGVINLIRSHSPARFWTVMICALLLCFSALVLEPGVGAYLFFILFLGASTCAINAAHLQFQLASLQQSGYRLDRRYLRQMLRATPIGLLTAAAVFLLFPRINNLVLDLPIHIKQRFKTGFSGQIDLSAQGSIERDERVVMHVTASNSPWLKEHATDLYLRGQALDQFNGSQWLKSPSDLQGYSRYQPLYIHSRGDLEATLDVAITGNPIHTPIMFLPAGSFLIKEVSGTIDRMLIDPIDGSLRRANDHPVRSHYITQVFPSDHRPDLSLGELKEQLKNLPTIDEPKPFQLDHSHLQRYLMVDPRVGTADYFQNWMSQFSIADHESIQSVLSELRNHFRTNYQATLLNQFSGPEALESFLSRDRYGHCELFATASVLALRLWGIPARIVTGYRGGEYNPVADAAIVKQYQAHAWVEYFVADSGWHRFDPTPMLSPVLQESLRGSVMQYYHAANYWLNRYLVDFNLRTQRDIVRQVRQQLKQPFSLKDLWSWQPLLGLVLGSLTAIFGWLGWRYYRRRRKRPRRPHYYRRFLKSLQQFGLSLEKQPYEGWSEFHKRVAASGLFDNSDLQQLEQILLADLYSSKQGSFEQQGEQMVLRLISFAKQRQQLSRHRPGLSQ